MSEATDGDGTRSSVEHASRDQLRAMAHPLRLEIMERVGRRGTARAADLAEDLGIPANSVSYHLRILARGGVVEEAPEAARDRRDRVWRLAQISFLSGREGRVPGEDPEAGSEYLQASGAASLAVFDWMRTAWAAEAGRHPDRALPSEGATGQQLFATSVRLTAEEMEELNRVMVQALHEAKNRHRDEEGVDLPDPEDGEARRTYRVMWAAVGEQPPA